MTPKQANAAIRNAMELWKEWWPHRDLLSPEDRYIIRRIDAGLRYVAEKL